MISLSNYFMSKLMANYHAFQTKTLSWSQCFHIGFHYTFFLRKWVVQRQLAVATTKRLPYTNQNELKKASTFTNQRSILEMRQGNADKNSENKNSKSGDNNSLETLQEQNAEIRSESTILDKRLETNWWN